MQICPLLRTEMLVAGTVVVREGDVARNLFFLIDGKVRPSPRALHAAAPRCGRQRCAVSSPCQPVRPRAKPRRVQIQCLRNDIRNIGDLYPISVIGEDLLCAKNGDTRSSLLRCAMLLTELPARRGHACTGRMSYTAQCVSHAHLLVLSKEDAEVVREYQGVLGKFRSAGSYRSVAIPLRRLRVVRSAWSSEAFASLRCLVVVQGGDESASLGQ